MIFMKASDSMKSKVFLFDLDGTLLRSDKTISERTAAAVRAAKENGAVIGISTSRGLSNSKQYVECIEPDIIISSGGAFVSMHGETVLCECFTENECRSIIAAARRICGDISITADIADESIEYFRNFIPPADELEASWGRSEMTDFNDFSYPALKLCFEIFDENNAEKLRNELSMCDSIRFTESCWYKFTKKGITKESAINAMCARLGITADEVCAFGDDLADIGMLRLCGTGVAMGNALDEVKAAADVVIGTNDDDGIAAYLYEIMKDHPDAK